MKSKEELLPHELYRMARDANMVFQKTGMQGFCKLMVHTLDQSELHQLKRFLDEYLKGTDDGSPVQN